MANFDAKNIRNVVILGHQGSGKTSFIKNKWQAGAEAKHADI